jgi:hypothetical protein
MDPFALFCAYHLGLDVTAKEFERRARHRNIHDVARLFGVGVDDVERALVANKMDAARMLEIDFDVTSAQLDIQASPPGVDLPSIARMHYDLFLEAPEKKRDWERELREDEAANAATFAKRTKD